MYGSSTRRLIEVAVAFAILAFTISASAQTSVLSGKCIGQDGNPLVGYTVQLTDPETGRTMKVKTNKKGEYTYMGLERGNYKITLLNAYGTQVASLVKRIPMNESVALDFDMGRGSAPPENAPKTDAQQQEHKQFGNLKQTFEQAALLYDQKRYSEAAAALEHALPMAKDKNVPIVLGRLGDAYVQVAAQDHERDARVQDQQKAIDYYQKAIQAAPAEASFHNNLGGLYASMGKIDEAQAEYHKAADLNPSGASSYYYNLGVIMVNQGKMDEAAVSLKKATDLDPSNGNAFYWYGMALLGKAETKADGTVVPVPGTVEAFQNYLKLQPNGQWAQAAQTSLDQIKSGVPTEYKAAPKKKKS